MSKKQITVVAIKEMTAIAATITQIAVFHFSLEDFGLFTVAFPIK